MMFSHVTLGCSNLERAIKFYDAVLSVLGHSRQEVLPDRGPASACWMPSGKSLPEFFINLPFNGQAASVGNGNMVAFVAVSKTQVDKAYAVALQHGARNEGAPGARCRYGAGYYGAYFRDLDGNKVHIAYRGDIN